MGDQLSSPPQTTRQRFRAHRSVEFTEKSSLCSDVYSQTTSSGEIAVLICWFELMNSDIQEKTGKTNITGGKLLYVNLYIYIYGYGSKNPLDRPAVIRTSGTRGLRKGAWSRGLQGAKWYDMKCLHESVARPKVTWKGGEIWNRSSQLEARKETKFLTRRYMELVVVWIGSGSVWIRVWIGLGLELNQLSCVCCSLDAVWQEKDNKVKAASGHLGCLAAWPCNSVSLVARQLGCLRIVALNWKQFVAWLLGRVNNCRHQLAHKQYHSKGLDQRSGSTPLERSGSGVWIRGLDRLWDRGLIQTLHFEPQPYKMILIGFQCTEIYKVVYLHMVDVPFLCWFPHRHLSQRTCLKNNDYSNSMRLLIWHQDLKIQDQMDLGYIAPHLARSSVCERWQRSLCTLKWRDSSTKTADSLTKVTNPVFTLMRFWL